MSPSIPQPTYPGGGAFGTPPNYQPLNTGTPGTAFGGPGGPGAGAFLGAGVSGAMGTGILGSAQAQDLVAQSLMQQNFAANPFTSNVYNAQMGFQGLLNPMNQLAGMSVPTQQNALTSAQNFMQLGQNSQNQSQNVANLLNFAPYLSRDMAPGAMSTMSNAAKGIYANPNLQTAYNTFTGEASGAQPINPVVQQQMMQAGLTNAAQNLAPTSLGTGQTGEAQVATNFGQNAQQYIQNMQTAGLQGMQGLQGTVQGGAQNVLSSLSALTGQQLGANEQAYAQSQGLSGEAQAIQQMGASFNQQNMGLQALEGQMFPKTQIGLTGTDLANMMIANTQGQNQFNQNTWLAQMQAAQYNSSVQGANAGAQASSTSGLVGAGISAVAVAAMFCWVAREVFTEADNRWLRFREWMLNKAPAQFRRFYLEKGQQLAQMLRDQPDLKDLVRHLMLAILETYA